MIDWNNIKNCLVTGIQLEERNFIRENHDMVFTYEINFQDKCERFSFSERLEHWVDDESEINDNARILDLIHNAIEPIKHILIGLLLNNKWIPKKTLLTKKVLKRILDNSSYPATPKEKLDNLMIELSYMFSDDHSFNSLDAIARRNFGTKQIIGNSIFSNYFYMKNSDEFFFYFNTLFNDGLIEVNESPSEGAEEYRISYNGLNHLVRLTEEGVNSNLCFVAMSFDGDYQELFADAIRPACEQAGFVARKIDDEIYDSETTINDAMISLMKRCRFMISDFTKHKHNVYFETGYCLGRGMKVIYTCNKKDFNDSKFDTNHFPHIIYDDKEDLRNKLIDKINAFIVT